MRVQFFLGVIAVAWGAGIACGGASDTGLFGGSSSSSDSDSGTTTGNDGGGTNHLDAGTTPQDAGGKPVDASPPKDSGPPPPQDSGPPPGDQGVQCGGSVCAVPQQECCRRQNGGQTSYACVQQGQCNGGNNPLAIPCDDTADCATAGMPNTVCCATYSGGATSTAVEVACIDPTECNAQFSRVQVCDKSVTNECPAGTSCQLSSVTLPQYYICR